MIWHFLEVWALVAVAFGIGCALGAVLYSVIGDSRLAPAQGAFADSIGDAFDGIKVRLGLGPAWRPHHLRAAVARPAAPLLQLDSPQETLEGDYDYDYEDEDHLSDDPDPVEMPSEEHYEAEPGLARQPVPNRIASRQVLDARTRVQPDEPLFVGGDPERVQSAMAVGDDGVVPMRPAGLSGPRGGVPDNLTRIRGIGSRNEELLNTLGFFHFGQIAAWTPGEVRWIGQYLAFPERIERDDWVGQAMVLASGGETGFEKSAERRRRRRRLDQQAFLARQVALGVATVMKGEKASEDDDEADVDIDIDIDEKELPEPPEAGDTPLAEEAEQIPDDAAADEDRPHDQDSKREDEG